MNAWQKIPWIGVDGPTTRDELGSGSLIMDWQSPRNKNWIRTIAILLTICFVHQDLVWAQGGTPIWAKGQGGSVAGKTEGADGQITIPKDVATTKEVYKSATGDKTIINIQAAHASLGAQESKVTVIDSLETNYDLKDVAI